MNWPGRVLCEDDLRRYWTGQSEILVAQGTVVTPLAVDWLRSKRVAVRRGLATSDKAMSPTWGWTEQTPTPLVQTAVTALLREGRALKTLSGPSGTLSRWWRDLADAVTHENPAGAIVFCEHPALAACVANKVDGVRAAVASPGEIAELQRTMGPNLYAIAPRGRTLFELRTMLRLATNIAPKEM